MSSKLKRAGDDHSLDRFETILLDMDGTLLDLAFDNYFWRELVPEHFARQSSLTEDQARERIYDLYAGREGTLDWYCLNFWEDQLNMDLQALKLAASYRIQFLPGAREFLTRARDAGKRLVLVTNAHNHTLRIKNDKVQLDKWIDEFVCSHDLGLPKERLEFWHKLESLLGFNPATTLFVDDSLPVLDAALEYGLAGVVAIRQPSTEHPPKDTEDHHFVDGVHHWL